MPKNAVILNVLLVVMMLFIVLAVNLQSYYNQLL
jgi:hypothetical protein